MKISKKQRTGRILTKDTTLFVITPPNKLLTVFFFETNKQTKVSNLSWANLYKCQETSVFWYEPVLETFLQFW